MLRAECLRVKIYLSCPRLELRPPAFTLLAPSDTTQMNCKGVVKVGRGAGQGFLLPIESPELFGWLTCGLEDGWLWGLGGNVLSRLRFGVWSACQVVAPQAPDQHSSPGVGRGAALAHRGQRRPRRG